MRQLIGVIIVAIGVCTIFNAWDILQTFEPSNDMLMISCPILRFNCGIACGFIGTGIYFEQSLSENSV